MNVEGSVVVDVKEIARIVKKTNQNLSLRHQRKLQKVRVVGESK